MRHDQPKEAFALEASKFFRDVQVEPPLEAVSGEVMRHKSAIVSDEEVLVEYAKCIFRIPSGLSIRT